VFIEDKGNFSGQIVPEYWKVASKTGTNAAAR